MTKPLTQEEFLKQAEETHEGLYGHSKAIYTRANKKVVVTCAVHGDFEIIANNYLRGRGCPKCSCRHTKAKENFVQKSTEVHGDVYDYSEAEYVHSLEKVKIGCKVHGPFYAVPSSHVKGFGCARCSYDKMAKSKKKSQEDYLSQATDVHGDKYCLEKVQYTDCRDKITVTCPEHGDFKTQANSFLQGHGCPSCMEGGFSQLKPGTLYVMTHGDICKVGVTNQTTTERAYHIYKSSKLEFEEVFEQRFEKGSVALTIERIVLKELREKYKNVDRKFNGYTECFLLVDLPSLLSRIEALVAEHSPQ